MKGDRKLAISSKVQNQTWKRFDPKAPQKTLGCVSIAGRCETAGYESTAQ